jgi:hypothetical protein
MKFPARPLCPEGNDRWILPPSAGQVDSCGNIFVFPVSHAQRRLWFVQQLNPRDASYHVALNWRITGDLNIGALRKSLTEILRRHEVLRTAFPARDGEPMQEVRPPLPAHLPTVDLSHVGGVEAEDIARNLRQLARELPFDLEQGPVLRTALVRLQADNHELQLVVHHIVFDGWSEAVLTRELRTLYEAYHAGERSPLPELTIQYADYTVWQQDWLQGELLEEQILYWRRNLLDLPALDLPRDYAPPQRISNRGEELALFVSAAVGEGLGARARGQKATLFMVLLAGFQLLLSRYAGQKDVAVGTAVANRRQPEMEDLIGFFVNTLVLRTDLTGNITFRGLLRRVRSITLEAYSHSDVPFEKVVEELHPERTAGTTPLIQAVLVLQNTPATALDLPGAELQQVPSDFRYSFGDVCIAMREKGGELEGLLLYPTDLYARESMICLARYYEHLLGSVAADPDQNIDDIQLIPVHEQQLLQPDGAPFKLRADGRD